MKEIKILPPFKNFILENFPFIEEDFDALTNYELLCHVVNYIKTMGDEFNTIANDVNGLLNWFNNLDVQDEINNKLDEMVEDGTLQEIIADYLNSKAIFGFDSVADMKSTTNLIDGSFAKTMGYYAKNDGGSSLYKIREITNDDVVDEMFIIALSDNTLIAELIYGDSVNIDQLGCKGDNSTNNSTLLNAILNNNKISHITLSKDKTYLCNSTITISKSIFLDGNMGTLKSLSSDNGFVVEILPASGETVHDVEPFIIKNSLESYSSLIEI